MNESQLTQVLDTVKDATAFDPGESHQLVPVATPEQKAVQTRNNIIEDATRLAADIKAVYREQVEEAQREYEKHCQIADLIVDNAIKQAEEVDKSRTRRLRLGAKVSRALEEEGFTFEGEI